MKAVILAAGRGTRMQRAAAGVQLDAGQRAMAELGAKGLIPIAGRPFLDYAIRALSDAGVRDVCFVVGPGAHPVRAHYAGAAGAGPRIHFAVQDEPLGAAHALQAAEPFAGGDAVLVINADNYYPTRALVALGAAEGSALAGFDADVLVTRGNIPRDRLAAFAIVQTDAEGYLSDIIEKPSPAERAAAERDSRTFISMTCWRFRAPIFAACRAIGRSARGEYELPDAVVYAVRRLGEPFRVIPVREPVLDLTSRDDVESVERWFRDHEVSP